MTVIHTAIHTIRGIDTHSNTAHITDDSVHIVLNTGGTHYDSDTRSTNEDLYIAHESFHTNPRVLTAPPDTHSAKDVSSRN